jgi:hypothetical protein
MRILKEARRRGKNIRAVRHMGLTSFDPKRPFTFFQRPAIVGDAVFTAVRRTESGFFEPYSR